MRSTWAPIIALAFMAVTVETYEYTSVHGTPSSVAAEPLDPAPPMVPPTVPVSVAETNNLTPLPTWGSPPLNPAPSVKAALLNCRQFGLEPVSAGY